jgi:hypothetical protein
MRRNRDPARLTIQAYFTSFSHYPSFIEILRGYEIAGKIHPQRGDTVKVTFTSSRAIQGREVRVIC